MSTPTTARGALLRRAGTLLVAAVLVGVPATSALADPTATPTSTSTTTTSPTTAGPTASATATPGPTVTTTAEPTPTPTPSASTSPSLTSPSPSASITLTPSAPTSAPRTGKAPLAALAISPEEAAAAFIASTLAEGDNHYVYPGGTWFDGGNTIDGIIALSAVGTQQAQANASLDYLEAHLADYAGSGKDLYAGPLAKALLAVVVAGGDPRSFATRDLVAELQSLETTKGRFSDRSSYGDYSENDYSNTIGQSLAVLALARSGQGLNAPGVQLLLAQQCADGGFRGALSGKGCSSDADATAFAVQALLVAGDTLLCGTGAEGLAADVAAAVGRGLDMLEEIQGTSGGFTSDDGAVNANTTGVAAQALTAGGRTSSADAAIAFVKSLQYDDPSKAALLGGIAFSADTRSTTTPSDSDLRATPQGTLGLAGSSLVDALAPGVEGAGPAEQCPAAATRAPLVAAPPTTTPSPSGVPTPTGGSTQGAGGSDPSTAVDASATGSLAQTGTDLFLPVLLGLLLVVVGGVAVFASTRRRGAHA